MWRSGTFLLYSSKAASEPKKHRQDYLMSSAQSFYGPGCNRQWTNLWFCGSVPLLHTSTQCPGMSLHVISFTRQVRGYRQSTQEATPISVFNCEPHSFQECKPHYFQWHCHNTWPGLQWVSIVTVIIRLLWLASMHPHTTRTFIHTPHTLHTHITHVGDSQPPPLPTKPSKWKSSSAVKRQ